MKLFNPILAVKMCLLYVLSMYMFFNKDIYENRSARNTLCFQWNRYKKTYWEPIWSDIWYRTRYKLIFFISSISFPTFLTKISYNDNLYSFSISAYKRNQLWCNNTSICQNHYKNVCFSRNLLNDACVKMF